MMYLGVLLLLVGGAGLLSEDQRETERRRNATTYQMVMQPWSWRIRIAVGIYFFIFTAALILVCYGAGH